MSEDNSTIASDILGSAPSLNDPAEDAPELKAMRIQGMLLDAIVNRTTFDVIYHMSRKPTVSDFERMEQAVNGWLCDTLRGLGAKIPRRRIFRLNMQEGVWKDDGVNDVTLTLDFAKLLGVRAGSGVEGTTQGQEKP